MSIEDMIRAGKTKAERIEVCRAKIREALDANTPNISGEGYTLELYGDACFALGYLKTAAERNMKHDNRN